MRRKGWPGSRMTPQAFDLLLTDRTMPRLTGPELIAAALQLRPGLPALLMSGLNEIDDNSAPGYDFVAKPLDISLLSQAVRRSSMPTALPDMDPQPSNSRGCVLIADDDQGARDSLLLMLRRLGYMCESAATADQALTLLRAAPAEVLLSDIHMPGNIKLELVEAATKVMPGLPVVLLTGRPSVETAARSVRLPVSAYLTKPPDLQELTRELDRAIAGFREYTLIQAGRKRLQDWERELSQIETMMRHPSAEVSTGALEDFIRVSLRQAIMTLADLERATQVLDSRANDRLRAVEHVAALRHAVEVLERTRQNFKSKDLADLRRQLEQLLIRTPEKKQGIHLKFPRSRPNRRKKARNPVAGSSLRQDIRACQSKARSRHSSWRNGATVPSAFRPVVSAAGELPSAFAIPSCHETTHPARPQQPHAPLHRARRIRGPHRVDHCGQRERHAQCA